MTPRFNNKDGTLTDYALACGYVERATFPPNVRPAEAVAQVTLERHAGTRAYSVSTFGRYLRRADYDGPSLSEARRAFRKARRNLEQDEKSAAAEFHKAGNYDGII